MIKLRSWFRLQSSPSQFITVLSDGWVLIWFQTICKLEDHDNVGWQANINRKCPALPLHAAIFVRIVRCLRRLYCKTLSDVSHRSGESCFFFVFLWILNSLWWGHIMARRSCLHFFTHYTIPLSSCTIIRKCWRYKMLVRYILSSVCLRLSIILYYMGLCLSAWPLLVWWLREYFTSSHYHIIYFKSERYRIWIISPYSWNDGMVYARGKTCNDFWQARF